MAIGRAAGGKGPWPARADKPGSWLNSGSRSIFSRWRRGWAGSGS